MTDDNRSQETLRRVEQNDCTLTDIRIEHIHGDFSRLGTYIGMNTYLQNFFIRLSDETVLEEDDGKAFFEGLKRNTSINDVSIKCYRNDVHNLVGGVGHEVLEVYQENNHHLTRLEIGYCNIENGGDSIIATTVRRCFNLIGIDLHHCNITDEQLLPIVEGLRGHRTIEKLNLSGNRIGGDGCNALATLLEDTSCTLQRLGLNNNEIRVGAATTIANSLVKNKHLLQLYLYFNISIETIETRDAFSRTLCNTSSVNDTYLSNHTLTNIAGIGVQPGSYLESLLRLNRGTNKSHTAIKKILRYHPIIDMEPLFEWDAEEGERNLKALPYVIRWFDSARAVVANEADTESSFIRCAEVDKMERQKLCALLQFAKAMPLLFVPASHIIKHDRKRKRDNI